MIRKLPLLIPIVFVVVVACSKRTADTRLRVEVPPGFSGNVVLNMGVRDAPPLTQDGDAYVVSVPRDGKIETSTMMQKPKVQFKNGSDGGVWGYSEREFTTGDGISTSGAIEFFVGTQKEFEAEQKRKNKSGYFFKSVTARCEA